jgi:hypothetical protein
MAVRAGIKFARNLERRSGTDVGERRDSRRLSYAGSPGIGMKS